MTAKERGVISCVVYELLAKLAAEGNARLAELADEVIGLEEPWIDEDIQVTLECSDTTVRMLIPMVPANICD